MSNESYPDLADRVREDPEAEPIEKEFGMVAVGGSNTFTLTVKRAGMMRRVLNHPEIGIKDVTVRTGRHEYSTHSDPENLPADGDIVTVIGEAPVGLLKIQSVPRKSNSHTDVVSPHRPET